MELEDNISNYKTTKDELQKTSKNAKLPLSVLDRPMDEDKQKIVALKCQVSDMYQMCIEKDKALAAVRETVTNLQAELVSSEERCHALNKELDCVRRSSTELETRLHAGHMRDSSEEGPNKSPDLHTQNIAVLKEQLFNTSKELKDTQKLLENTKKSLHDVTGEFYNFRLQTEKTMQDIDYSYQQRQHEIKEDLCSMNTQCHDQRLAQVGFMQEQSVHEQERVAHMSLHIIDLLAANGSLREEVECLSAYKIRAEEAEYQLTKTNHMLEESVSRADLLASEARCQDLERRLHLQQNTLNISAEGPSQIVSQASITQNELALLRATLIDKDDILLKSTKQADELRSQLWETEQLLWDSRNLLKDAQDRRASSESSEERMLWVAETEDSLRGDSVPRADLEACELRCHELERQLASLKVTLEDVVQALLRMSACEDELAAVRRLVQVHLPNKQNEDCEFRPRVVVSQKGSIEDRVTGSTSLDMIATKKSEDREMHLHQLEGRLASTMRSLASTEAALEQMTSNKCKLESKVESLQTQLQDKEWALSLSKNKIDDLRAQLDNVRAQCSDIQDHLASTEQALAKAEISRDNTKDALELMTASKSSLEYEFRSHKESYEELKDRLASTEQALAKAEISHDNTKDALELMTASKSSLESEIRTLKESYEELKDRLASTEQALAKAEISHDNTKDALELMTASKSSLESEIRTLKESYEELKGRLASTEQSLDVTMDALEHMTLGKTSLESEYSDFRLRFQTTIEEMTRSWQTEMETTAERLVNTKQALATTQQTLESTTLALEKMTADRANIEAEYAEFKARFEGTVEEMSRAYMEEMEGSDERCADLERRLKELTDIATVLNKQLLDRKSDIIDTEKQLADTVRISNELLADNMHLTRHEKDCTVS